MSAGRDEGPVYYREIQKNAYLKRIPIETSGSKLRPLGHKKPPLKPMWTLLCVHNGRTPFLEQYPDAESPATLAHKPVWRACLRAARHVTASVKPHVGDEYDFLVDTDHGPVRMLAPDWDSMQDWVLTLRNKLHELKVLSKGENVYCAPPAAPAPRAAARDPTSPLPPTPPVPPDRVPGIELNTQITRPTPAPTTSNTTETPDDETATETPNQTEPPSIDISNWDVPFSSIPSTSQEPKMEPQNSVAKICGQNICLDDSIFRRNPASTDSDEDFFAEIDRISESVENLEFEERSESYKAGYMQRVVVNNGERASSSHSVGDPQSERQGSNITVIQVSNKPPHTAIPVLGPEIDIFDFNFKQNLPCNPEETHNNFINIVNTETQNNSEENNYGTVFSKDESEYGHLSLATTVSLTGDKDESVYERLCMASTSNGKASPLPVRRLKNLDKNRKSSLPNLDIASSSESLYEYLFPNFSRTHNNNGRTTTNIIYNSSNIQQSLVTPNGRAEINSNVNITSSNNINNVTANNEISRNVTANNEASRNVTANNETSRNVTANNEISRSVTANNEISRNVTANDQTSRNFTTNNEISRNVHGNNEISRNLTANNELSRSAAVNNETSRNVTAHNEITPSRPINVHVNLTNSISVGSVDPNSSAVRSNVERSHSQNAYDASPRLRDHLIRRINSPKRESKNDKAETPNPKPIWKRGLTELSLLSRLRGIGQGKRHESPTRHDSEALDRGVTSPGKVVHRSRPEARIDGTRRRSSSLSNGQSPPARMPPHPALQPLRARQAASLRAEQRRGAAVAASVPVRDPPVFCEYNRQVWVAWWAAGGARCGGRAGDRVAALRGTPPRDVQHARQLLKTSSTHLVDILFHRVPLGKIYVLNKRDLESIGIKLDAECNVSSVESQSAGGRAGLPPPGKWAVTEVNNRPLNLLKGGEEEMNRLSLHGTEVSVLIQPSALVKKIRAALKASKPLSMR